MSEIRQSILTRNRTVMAPERGEKPEQFRVVRSKNLTDYPKYDEACPFCPGNEKKFEIVPIEETRNDDGQWLRRVIENKYKIFDDYATCPIEPEPFKKHGVYTYYQGCGNHYLVLEHPQHNKVMGQMQPEQLQDIFGCYLKTLGILKKNPNNLIAIIFKNQGVIAGASQVHAQS